MDIKIIKYFSIESLEVKNMIDTFKNWVEKEGMSDNTIISYTRHIKNYLIWFKESFNVEFTMLYRQNILGYISYMSTIKRFFPQLVDRP